MLKHFFTKMSSVVDIREYNKQMCRIVNEGHEPFTVEINGKKFHYYIVPKFVDHNIIKSILKTTDCWECQNRLRKTALIKGQKGYLINKKSLPSYESKIAEKIENISNSNKFEYEPYPITEENEFDLFKGQTENGLPFSHIKFCPTKDKDGNRKYTSKNLFNEYISVKNLYDTLGVGDEKRYNKLLSEDAYTNIKIIKEKLPKLIRPEHWEKVIEWVLLINEFYSQFKYAELTQEQEIRMKLYFVMSGKTDDAHLYFQADNIINFMEIFFEGTNCVKPDELIKFMDSRSDPANYLVDSFNKKMKEKRVTAARSTGVTWDTKFSDDLDLHVFVVDERGSELDHIYYNNKRGEYGQLDFDANVSDGEKDPCECISLSDNLPVGCKCLIYVNNYTRRTKLGKEIPFKIVINEKGKIPKIIDSCWPANKAESQTNRMQDMQEICTYQFGKVEETNIVMSDKQKRKAIAGNKKWEEYFGDVSSEIASYQDLPDNCEISYCNHKKNMNSIFMDLAQGKDMYPENNDELMNKIKEGNNELLVHFRDVAPGYITKIGVKNEKALKKGRKLGYCVFQHQNKIPVEPVFGARCEVKYDEDWCKSFDTNFLKVDSIIKLPNNYMRKRQLYFIVLKNTKLPDSSKYPLSSGCYPSAVSTECWELRSRYSFCNTIMTPEMKTDSVLIGSFLLGEDSLFKLNGNNIYVKN